MLGKPQCLSPAGSRQDCTVHGAECMDMHGLRPTRPVGSKTAGQCRWILVNPKPSKQSCCEGKGRKTLRKKRSIGSMRSLTGNGGSRRNSCLHVIRTEHRGSVEISRPFLKPAVQ